MTKSLLLSALLLSSTATWAANTSTDALNRSVDVDGFTNPLSQLRFNPKLGQSEFERSTFEALDVYDPFESFNRWMYQVDYRIDQYVMLPVVKGYTYVVPKPARKGVSNVFSNLGDVRNATNNALQLKMHRAGVSVARLLFNTIFGIGGLWDPATMMGLPKYNEDFGQTLGHYGVPNGPYLVLPVLGPSNVRDTTGLATDYFAEYKLNYLHTTNASRRYWAWNTMRVINQRYVTPFRYGQLNSPFEYEKVRYIYTKARELQIAD